MSMSIPPTTTHIPHLFVEVCLDVAVLRVEGHEAGALPGAHGLQLLLGVSLPFAKLTLAEQLHLRMTGQQISTLIMCGVWNG